MRLPEVWLPSRVQEAVGRVFGRDQLNVTPVLSEKQINEHLPTVETVESSLVSEVHLAIGENHALVKQHKLAHAGLVSTVALELQAASTDGNLTPKVVFRKAKDYVGNFEAPLRKEKSGVVVFDASKARMVIVARQAMQAREEAKHLSYDIQEIVRNAQKERKESASAKYRESKLSQWGAFISSSQVSERDIPAGARNPLRTKSLYEKKIRQVEEEIVLLWLNEGRESDRAELLRKRDYYALIIKLADSYGFAQSQDKPKEPEPSLEVQALQQELSKSTGRENKLRAENLALHRKVYAAVTGALNANAQRVRETARRIATETELLRARAELARIVGENKMLSNLIGPMRVENVRLAKENAHLRDQLNAALQRAEVAEAEVVRLQEQSVLQGKRNGGQTLDAVLAERDEARETVEKFWARIRELEAEKVNSQAGKSPNGNGVDRRLSSLGLYIFEVGKPAGSVGELFDTTFSYVKRSISKMFPDIDPEEIAKGAVYGMYRRLSRASHPDRNPEGGERFKKVQEAFEKLGLRK